MQEDSGTLDKGRLRKHSSQEDFPRLGKVNRSYSASSAGSVKERRPSQFLDLPPMVN